MERERKLVVLHEIAAALNASVALDDALETALEKAGQLMDLETGWVWLIDENEDEPYLAAARNLPEGLRSNPELMEGSCYCLDTFRTGDLEGAANVNVVRCSRLQQLDEGTEGFAFHTSVPLYGRDGARIGVLNLAATDWRELSDEELQTLQTVSDLVAMAVERTRLFERSLQLGAAEERNRLAREIHDTLAQGLAGLVMQLESIELRLDSEGGAPPLDEPVERALEMARENLRNARRSVENLRAGPLRGSSLDEALRTLLEDHADREGWDTAYEEPNATASISDRAERAAYHVAREALANAAEHAEADEVEVALRVEADRVIVRVRDDGSGFDPDEADGWGLVGMREWVDRIGGTFWLDANGTGTTVEATVPRERR